MGMMAVGLSADEAKPYLGRSPQKDVHKATVACINSPTSTTISRGKKELDALEATFAEDEGHVPKTSGRHCLPFLIHGTSVKQYQSLVTNISSKETMPGEPQMYSSVTQKPISHTDLKSSQYWVQNLLSPVQFLDAIGAFHASVKEKQSSDVAQNTDNHYFVEVGPHGALQRPLLDTLKRLGGNATPGVPQRLNSRQVYPSNGT